MSIGFIKVIRDKKTLFYRLSIQLLERFQGFHYTRAV